MKFVAYFRSVAAKFFHRSQLDAEMDDEVRSRGTDRAHP
jgi:hypothetical protein